MRNQACVQRHGNMLIDLLICMGAASALFLVTIDVVHHTLLVSRRSTEDSRTVQTIHRLDLQFRRDVREARGVSSDSASRWVVQRRDGKAEYTVEPKFLSRRWEGTAGDSQTERYPLPQDARVVFEVDSPLRLAKLRVSLPRANHAERVLLQSTTKWSAMP